MTGKDGDECAPACAAHAVGLVPDANPVLSGAFALARTADGASWVAYVSQDLAGEVDYTVRCPPEAGNCVCQASPPIGPTTWMLHVVRVAPDGASTTPALTASLDHYAPSDIAYWTVRAHAFGQHVVVATRIQQGAVDHQGVRVVTLEATE